ncbi:putative Bromodomain testis-specific protein [Nemania sp. FL0916]|nr:putative Bromodomain testis-specific protein [Nemania sp. FL0916]
MASEDAQDGPEPRAFSWLEPHPTFAILLIGKELSETKEPTAFSLHKDFLIAKSKYFEKYFAELGEQLEAVVDFPELQPLVFGLVQQYMFEGHLSEPLPPSHLLIDVWKLGDKLGIHGLCDKVLSSLSEHKRATGFVPTTDLLMKAWNETPEGSAVRNLLLLWTAEYIQSMSSESRSEATKSLPQEVLGELVVAMSHLNSTPPTQVKPPSSPASGQPKKIHYLDQAGDEREPKATKYRQSDGLPARAKKSAARSSLPTTPRLPKTKRSTANMHDESQYTTEEKLLFCSDLLNRMLSGPGFWTRLVGAFKEPVKPKEDGVPDYLEKIKKPMDLGTIKRKMDSQEYNAVEEFEADIRQIFENCYTYWGRDHDMSASAERFQKSFEEKFAEMYKWMSRNLRGADPQ